MDLICILDEPRYSNSWHKCNEVPEEVVFVASPDIDLGHPGPYRVAELLDKPFFLTERNANYRRTFDRFLASRQIELTPSLEILYHQDAGALLRHFPAAALRCGRACVQRRSAHSGGVRLPADHVPPDVLPQG